MLYGMWVEPRAALRAPSSLLDEGAFLCQARFIAANLCCFSGCWIDAINALVLARGRRNPMLRCHPALQLIGEGSRRRMIAGGITTYPHP